MDQQPSRVGRQVSRLRAMSRRQPFLTDSLLAAVLAVLTAPDVVVRHGSETPAAIVLHVTLWVPIAFRRQTPELVFGVTAGIAFVQWLVSVPVAGDAALLIALYTVAAHRRLDRPWPRGISVSAGAADPGRGGRQHEAAHA